MDEGDIDERQDTATSPAAPDQQAPWKIAEEEMTSGSKKKRKDRRTSASEVLKQALNAAASRTLSYAQAGLRHGVMVGRDFPPLH